MHTVWLDVKTILTRVGAHPVLNDAGRRPAKLRFLVAKIVSRFFCPFFCQL